MEKTKRFLDVKRIDPAAIPGVFGRHSLTPTQSTYLLNGSANLIAILAVNSVGMEKTVDSFGCLVHYGTDSVTRMLSKVIGLNYDYLRGLDRGWGQEPIGKNPSKITKLGYADGLAAWNALRGEQDS